ncbi:Uncharacterised protein [Candidatus Anstonella stagnisolia]|nr:Uncharacterised protein [Candidatus Anstonella stagnisolia]
MFSKGQGATEYLVLLAVVLMIALVSIALLGFFPGLAGDTKETQSDSYWKSARQFAILDSTQSGVTLSATLQNNDPDQRTVTTFAAGAASNGSLSVILNAGEKRIFSINNANVTACTTGNRYEYQVNLTYNTVDLVGLKQTGTKPLVGKCA